MHSSAHLVLDHYQLAGVVNVRPLGSRGGFSGARLWRGESLQGDICLRAWPESMSPDILTAIHQLMDQANQTGLVFVPKVYGTSAGQSYVVRESRCWDVTSWMPGVADFHRQPSSARLASACAALGQLHRAWAVVVIADCGMRIADSPHSAIRNPQSAISPCPAVFRRLERIRQWNALLDSGWRPDFARYAKAPWHEWGQLAWHQVQARLPEMPGKLAPWRDMPLPLQPCLCDIWHDHVLFTGDVVSGLIDYGSVKIDHVAVDLARLLGSLIGDAASMRRLGLEAYARVAPIPPSAEQLIDVLDKTGTVLGAANWLVWLYHDGRTFPDPEAVGQRLATLVRRMQTWQR